MFLLRGCLALDYGVSSCAGGFRDHLEIIPNCVCSCADPSCTGWLTCGGCPQPEGVAVAPGASVDAPWAAQRVTFESRGSYSCTRSAELPAGRYRLAVDVYASSDAALHKRDGHLKRVDFTLPLDGDVLAVALANADDVCDADANAPADACPVSSREIACSVSDPVSWRWDGGLSLYTDSTTLGPPATYTLTRTFNRGNPASNVSCSAPVPRCSRDARVITTADVVAALDDRDVKAAFAVPGMLIYGLDSRPSDGAIRIVSRGDASFGIGLYTCDPATQGSVCQRALPAGLESLSQLLYQLDFQEGATTACASLPTTPPP